MKYFILSLLALSVFTSNSQNIAQWRGVERDGIYNEEGLLKVWPEAGPKSVWDYEGIGAGYGSVVIGNDKIFVNGEIDSISHVFALNLDGTLAWKTPNGNEFMGEGFSATFPGARSTPTVVDDLVYACSGNGRIACLELETGKEKWAIDMKKDLNGMPNYFGYAESPLIDGNKLFCMPGGKDTNMVALDRFNGQIIWTSKALSDTITYCSPMLIKLPSISLVVTFSGRNLLGFNAETGELLWSHKQIIKEFNHHSNTPIYQNGFIYYVTSYGNGVVKLQLSADGKSITEVWRTEIKDNGFGAFLIQNEKIYGATEKNELAEIDIQTGEVTDSLKMKTGTAIYADGMLYFYSDNGKISLIDISQKPMKAVSDFKCDKGTLQHFSSLAIHKGVLYVRHGNALMAYDIKTE